MTKLIQVVRDVVIVVLLVGVVYVGGRWLLGGGGVSPEQARTIDSLRVETIRLAAVAESAQAAASRQAGRVDEVRAGARAKARADSLATARALDSLAALLPDTATVVPRPLHDAIVGQKDQQLAGLRRERDTLDATLVATRDTLAGMVPILAGLRRQNAALQVQVDDLERKANRRVSLCGSGGYGATASQGRLYTGATASIGVCYRLR